MKYYMISDEYVNGLTDDEDKVKIFREYEMNNTIRDTSWWIETNITGEDVINRIIERIEYYRVKTGFRYNEIELCFSDSNGIYQGSVRNINDIIQVIKDELLYKTKERRYASYQLYLNHSSNRHRDYAYLGEIAIYNEADYTEMQL